MYMFHLNFLFSQDLAVTRKRILEGEYRQIKEMIERDEKEAMHTIDKEQEKGQSKLVSLMKKFNENIERMSRTKSEINNLLDQSHSLTFLKVIRVQFLFKSPIHIVHYLHVHCKIKY